MKRFLNKILVFCSFFCFLLIFIIVSNYYFSTIKIVNNKHLLLIGHSHSECAFNDSLITELANYSRSGESYFYMFFKTKLLLDNNSQIDHVFIEFSNNQIDKHMDDWIWGNTYMIRSFPKYASLMNGVAFKLLWDNNSSCFFQCIVPWLKHDFKMITKGFEYNKSEIGGYLYLMRDKTDSLLANFSANLQPFDDPRNISVKNIEYLRKIIEYCKRKGVKVFLIRSPLHEKYTGFKNEGIFQNLLIEKFSDVEFLDFSKIPLANSEFGDLEHLNYKGAKIFSIWFASLINNGLLDKFNKQAFINEEIQSGSHNIFLK